MTVARASSDLGVGLEMPLPGYLAAGRGTAFFVKGQVAHPRSAVRTVDVLVDGVVRVRAQCLSGGFWGVVPVPPPDGGDGAIELAVRARLADGKAAVAPLGTVPVAEAPAQGAASPSPGRIAICMATYDPDPDLFRRQVESLRDQTDEGWTCLISDDCSPPERFVEIEATVAGDPRFTVSRSKQRLGFYLNFERALRMVPSGAELVALCDQDDAWYPDKLAVLRESLGDAALVYSDQRLVDATGRTLRDTLWSGRANNHESIVSLLVANTITGAASLFRREVAERALPFPAAPGFQFHDHWIGLIALASGRIAYVDRPLYDYVQHSGAVFGEVSGDDPGRSAAARETGADRLRERLTRWRAAYFHGYLARVTLAETLMLRCEVPAPKERALRRFAASERSALALLWLWSRSLRSLRGRNETLGSERQLVVGILWRWIAVLAGWIARRGGPARVDMTLPRPELFEQKRLRRWRSGA